MAEAMAMARHIAGGPRIAFAFMKRNLHAAETEPLGTVLDMEALGQARTCTTEDHREAARPSSRSGRRCSAAASACRATCRLAG